MKRVLIVALFGFFNLTITAQNYEWGHSFGSVNYDNAFAVETDLDGNHIVFGRHGGTTDFDPSMAVSNLVPSGSDIFIAKYTSDGNLVWAKQIDCSGSHTPFTLKVDSNNDIILGGSYGGTIDFDPGVGVQPSTSAGSDDMFIAKLDENGNYVWHYTAGATNNQVVNELTIDNNDNVVFTGYIAGSTVDFDPGPGVSNLTPNSNDIVVVKLSSAGNFQFAKIFTGPGMSFGYGIATDNLNNIYTTGNLGGNVDFDPGSGTYTLSNSGSINCFISKLDPSGNFVWAKGIHNVGTVAGRGIKIDSYQNIFVSGLFNMTTDFDLGAGTASMTPVGTNTNAFLLKLDPSGNYLWSKSVESSGGSSSNFNIALNNNNDVALIGTYTVNVDLGESGNTTSYPALGGNDCYYTVFDENGNYLFGHAFGGTGADYIYGVDFNDTELIICGYYSFNIGDIDPGVNNVNFNSLGGEDFFLIKYKTCTDNGSSQTISACDAYTWPTNGNTYTTSGVYTETLTNMGGCDSVVTLDLTINYSATQTQIISACNSFTWIINGFTYTSSGMYSEVFADMNGCDSIWILDLTINQPDNSTLYVVNSCESYTWPENNVTYNSSGAYAVYLTNMNGCDSIVVLNLTINQIYQTDLAASICNNENYELPDGNFVNASGVYISNLTSINGCDSIIETTLTVIAPNVNTSLSGTTLSADANSASYQWMRCPDYLEISGETNQDFEITQNGNYAVEITENGCTDTSDCVEINFMNFDENNTPEFSIYPNPSRGYFHLETNSTGGVNVKIYSATGSLIKELLLLNRTELNLPSGSYFIMFTNPSGQINQQKLIIL